MKCPDESSSDFSLSSIDSAKALSSNNNIINNSREKESSSVHTGAPREVTQRILRTPRQKLESKEICSSHKPKRAHHSYVPTKDIQEVIDFWNNLGLKSCNEGTLIYNKAIQMMKRARRGKIGIREDYKFSYDEIKEAIKKFSLSVQDPHYYPSESNPLHKTLKGTNLGDFIYSEWTTKSWMIKYLEEPLKKAEDTSDLNDEYPDITEVFINLYIRKVLGGIAPKKGFNYYDRTCFVKAAQRTVEFFKDNRRRMNLHLTGSMTVVKFAKLVWEALDRSLHGEVHKLTPGWLCSDATFQKKLPAYLYREGIVERK